ncbi:hypothetical protein B296_00056901 [Ensete ventricosum]|uniref:Uncharacterized protein n=1 Tax=Ensete ventricosum TaxID=4639 RepID=A0A426X350_ENSVE|nr:hypothetical protein B296_00056901 [Ensete ventricosum]
MMHSLRFPNSGIRAKATRRRGCQPRPAPHVGHATHGKVAAKAPCRGGGGDRLPARTSLQGAVAARRGGTYGQKRRLRAQPLATRRLQGGPAVGCQQGATACRGDSAGRPLAERLLVGKGRHRLCKGNDNGGGAKGARGVRASFGEKDDPTPMNLENFEDYPPYFFLIYCWVCVPVIICNYMERHSGSVEVITGPTIPWREITTHGDAMIRRNR